LFFIIPKLWLKFKIKATIFFKKNKPVFLRRTGNYDDELVTFGELAYPLEPGNDRVAWIP